LHTPVDGAPDGRDEVEMLRDDARLAAAFGFDAQFVPAVPPHDVPGKRFGNQATFAPARYLAPLLRALAGPRCHVFEDTGLGDIEQHPRRVRTSTGHAIDCEFVVIATHNPHAGSLGALGASLFQTKLSLYTTYVLGARLPAGTLIDALFWDTSDPYEYLRIEPRGDHQLVIFGGADTKTGQEGDEHAFEKLELR